MVYPLEEPLPTLITLFNNAEIITDVVIKKLFDLSQDSPEYVKTLLVFVLIGVGSVLMHMLECRVLVYRPHWRAQG